MLVNFRFDNFLSINELVEFSMVPGRTKGLQDSLINLSNHKKLLKISAIYGANASGKSSFIKALLYARFLIVNGFQDKLVFTSSFNKNKPDNKRKESRFEFEIVVGNRTYSYGFSVILSERKFVKEWLYDVTDEETLIYTVNRELQEFSINDDFIDISQEDKQRLYIYIEDNIQDENQLFLNALQDGKKAITINEDFRIFDSIFEWFSETLEVLQIDDEARGSIPSVTLQDEVYKMDLGTYLDMNDTGVVDLVPIPVENLEGIPAKIQSRIQEQIISSVAQRKNKQGEMSTVLKTPTHIFIITVDRDNSMSFSELKFKHKNGTLYSLFEESDGTVRLVELFSVLFNNKDKVFVIDEIDRSLHPLLTYNFIKSFRTKKGNNQLIVTTHEDMLLDFSVLRRDEIWFVEKNEEGNTSLYSLEEFKERFDKNIANAYLDGRYGAVPRLQNLFTSLIEEGR